MRKLSLLLLILVLIAGCGNEANAPRSAEAGTPEGGSPSGEATATAGSTAAPTETPAPPAAAGQRVVITPDDPGIQYMGRVDFSKPARPRFDWPAVTIAANFTGTSLTLILEDGQNSYNIYIDGERALLQTRPGQQSYVLAEGLAEGKHTFRMVKRTETFYGTPAFLGLTLDPGHALAEPSEASSRKIEFIGDSITAGYGTEGGSPTCTFSKETENAELTYAAMTADQLDAAYAIIAVSGIGIVRNYGAADQMSSGTMLTTYGRTLGSEPAEDWNFTRWVPDAVVINLGTNDFSTQPKPAGELFLRGYVDLIVTVRNRYPTAEIFAVAGPVMAEPADDTIHSAVEQARQILGDERVHFVQLEDTLVIPDDYGCDYHPNERGQQKMAAQLAPAIASVMGW